jgi:DUF2934 family protein
MLASANNTAESEMETRARGFEPGHELDDWLLAEREIDAALAGASRAAGRAGG